MGKIGVENEEHADHQSQAFTSETAVTKHLTTAEGLETMEINTESSYNGDKLGKHLESHGTVSVGAETTEQITQEKHKEVESAATDAEESPRPVIDLEEKQTVTCEVFMDSGKMVPQEEMLINGATNLEFSKTKTKSVPEDESLPTLPTTASVEVETVEESIQEEIHKEAESAVIDTDEKRSKEHDFEEKKTLPKAFNLHKATAEIVNKDVPQSATQSLKTIVMNHGNSDRDTKETKPCNDTEELERVLSSYIAEKSEIKDTGKFTLEEANEMEEAIDTQLQESAKESIPDNDAPSTLPTSALVKVEMLEEIFQEPTLEEEESAAIDNGSNRPENELEQTAKVVEAIDLTKTKSKVSTKIEENADPQSEVPTMETTTEPVGVKTVEESIQEKLYKEDKSTVTGTKEGQIPENDLEDKKKVPEDFDQHKVTSNVSGEKEKKDEPESDVQSAETTVMKLDVETAETNLNDYTEELEKVPTSDIRERIEIKNGEEIVQEEEKEMEEATNTPLPISAKQSVPGDKMLLTINTATVGVKTIEERIQDKIHEEVESAVTDDKEGQIPENNFREKKNVLEEFYLYKATGNTPENGKNAETQSEVDSVEALLTKLQNFEVLETKDISPSSNTAELEKIPESYIGDKLETEEEIDMQLTKSETETAKLVADDQSDMHESPKIGKIELPAEKIPEPPYPSKKVEFYPDHEAHDLNKEQLPQTKEKSNNIQDPISESDDDIQGRKFQCENQIKPTLQMEAGHHFNIPVNAKQTSAASLIAEQVKDDNTKSFTATNSNDQKVITSLNIKTNPTEKEASGKYSENEVIEPEAIEKEETQEAESPQIGEKEGEGGDELEKISPTSSGTTTIQSPRDADAKTSHKKSHGILSGVGSKVKHSISKVKKAMTGKSSHPKALSPK